MSPYSHDEPLDPEQIDAIEAGEKAISVLAGPGSGKTRTLAHRARALLLADREARALLLTFTNKAAAEMKSRALSVGDIASERLESNTFHGFGTRFLKSHGNLVGIDPDFDILDGDEAKEFATEVANNLGLPNQFFGWSRARLRRLTAGPAVATFGEAYEDAKRAEELLDFDDLVVYPAQILEERPEVAGAYGSRYEHILLDEFQDTNPTHFAIVSALAPHGKSVSVFADDDQAIMRFAGAEAANVRQFTEELDAHSYPLSRNHRSREAIVAHANSLISADPQASGRQMVPVKDGGTVELQEFGTTMAEASAIGDEIADLIFNEGVSPAEIAVLVRSGWRADEIVGVLSGRGVPLTDWRGATYESEERRMMIACFSTVRASLRTRHASRLSELIGVELIEERDTEKFLEAHAGSPVAAELLMLRKKVFDGGRPSEIATHAQAAVTASNPEAEAGARAIVEAIADFEEFDPNFTLEQLMAELALKSGGRSPTQGGGVKVATLHATKGLQWPRVYMIGLEEGNLPDYRAEDDDAIAEERRCCFVGACRAEDHLTFSWSRRYRTTRKRPSRFISEMGL